MASGSRYIPNQHPHLRQVPDSHQQLIASLTRLVRGSPPQRAWISTNKSKPKGLFSGPTSIAYLFFWLSRTYPDLKINDKSPHEWCLAYLDCGSGDFPNAQGLSGCGIMNEFLAYHTVKAVSTQDGSSVSKLLSAVKHDFRYCPDADNEFFSGRAGTLSLLRIVRHFVPTVESEVNACIKNLTQHILKHVPWSFHGRPYIGAAHGVIGILTQLVLSDHALGKNSIVEEQLLELLNLQLPDGNWPTMSKDTTQKRSSDLVQYCHGSPGFVISLLKIRPFVRHELQQRIDTAVEKGRQHVWEKGLLRKEPNLCHGITGNMLALEDWAQREHFMAHATVEAIEKGVKDRTFIPGDDPFGLFWGEAGRAWGWMVLDARVDFGYPGYTDVSG